MKCDLFAGECAILLVLQKVDERCVLGCKTASGIQRGIERLKKYIDTGTKKSCFKRELVPWELLKRLSMGHIRGVQRARGGMWRLIL
jgi:hypothetical protein